MAFIDVSEVCFCRSFHSALDDVFVTLITRGGKYSVIRGADVVHQGMQLEVTSLGSGNSVASAYIDGQPCLIVAGSKGCDCVLIFHAISLETVHKLQLGEPIYSVSINHSSNDVFYGSASGRIDD